MNSHAYTDRNRPALADGSQDATAAERRPDRTAADATTAVSLDAADRATAQSATRLADAARAAGRVDRANRVLADGERRINAVGRQYGAQTDARLAGRVAEEHHAATLQADAARQGQRLTAHTTRGAGEPHAAADVVVRDGAGREVARAQVKYHRTPAKTAKAVSRPDYGDMQKVVPADQVPGVRTEAGRQAVRNAGRRPTMAKNYRHTAERASDRIEARGAESRPLTGAGARQLARDARQGEAGLGRIERPSMTRTVGAEMAGAAKSAAAGAARTAAAISGVRNLVEVARGEKSLGEAVKTVAADTSRAAATGAVTAATAVVIKAGTQAAARQAGRSAVGSVLRQAAKSSAPALVAQGLVDTAINVAQGRPVGQAVMKSATSVAASVAGAKAGAVAGAMIGGPVGAAIGGFAGGILGAMGVDSWFS